MHPFHDGTSSSAFGNLQRNILEEISQLANEYIAKASIAELEEYFINKCTINPLILHADEYHIENTSSTQINVYSSIDRAIFPGDRASVQGTRVDVAIPFEGAPKLWRLRASTYTVSGYPNIEIRDNLIVIKYSFPDDSPDPARLKQQIQRDIATLSTGVGFLAQDIKNHNNSIMPTVHAALTRKHQNALAAMNAVASLGIPMKRAAVPATYTVPAKRRQAPVSLPHVISGPYRPEPTLDIGEYEHILIILRSMSLVIERSPQSFATLNEEAIRTHFLIQLNGHYEGTATGETFNAEGKTDILIRVENRNIFIAECKFWKGPKSFDKAITQILGYLSWRDAKCALLIFNRGGNSTTIRENMNEIMMKRPEYRTTITQPPSVDSRYIIMKASDPGREILITTMLFDTPG